MYVIFNSKIYIPYNLFWRYLGISAKSQYFVWLHITDEGSVSETAYDPYCKYTSGKKKQCIFKITV